MGRERDTGSRELALGQDMGHGRRDTGDGKWEMGNGDGTRSGKVEEEDGKRLVGAKGRRGGQIKVPLMSATRG